MNSKFAPFLISTIGGIADYCTTVVGLNRGFYETHINYTPLTAIGFFMVINLVLSILPNTKFFNIAKYSVASAIFLGALNNSLVIAGVFGGWVI